MLESEVEDQWFPFAFRRRSRLTRCWGKGWLKARNCCICVTWYDAWRTWKDGRWFSRRTCVKGRLLQQSRLWGSGWWRGHRVGCMSYIRRRWREIYNNKLEISQYFVIAPGKLLVKWLCSPWKKFFSMIIARFLEHSGQGGYKLYTASNSTEIRDILLPWRLWAHGRTTYRSRRNVSCHTLQDRTTWGRWR